VVTGDKADGEVIARQIMSFSIGTSIYVERGICYSVKEHLEVYTILDSHFLVSHIIGL
jgi:hypothetical protein